MEGRRGTPYDGQGEKETEDAVDVRTVVEQGHQEDHTLTSHHPQLTPSPPLSATTTTTTTMTSTTTDSDKERSQVK